MSTTRRDSKGERSFGEFERTGKHDCNRYTEHGCFLSLLRVPSVLCGYPIGKQTYVLDSVNHWYRTYHKSASRPHYTHEGSEYRWESGRSCSSHQNSLTWQEALHQHGRKWCKNNDLFSTLVSIQSNQQSKNGQTCQ